MDKYIGKRFDGRYEIKELIGVGGMAYVYKAYDTIDDRVVAVKILKEEFLENDEFTRRFKNESKAIAILSHPNIVKVYDVSFSENLQYIVMEYIDGITLKEYLKGQKEVNWKETVHFVTQILKALQHAHDKGIVHRDVKPQNIMLLSDGTIKMTDFGIARFSRSDIRVTLAPEKAIGSVHYISPEQARGDLTDEKADIYSVGVMMYEMLTKHLPFDGDNAVSIAIMQMQSEPEKPSVLNPEIPEGLEEITLKAMQKAPEKRYQSAAEMLYDIDEFKRNPSIHFAYKYFVDDTPTRFVETTPLTDIVSDKEDKSLEEEEVRKGPPVVPILAVVTGALLLIVVAFISIASLLGGLNNDSTEITVENFVGKKYEEIILNEDYAKDYEFSKLEKSSTLYEAGVVMSQSLIAGKKEKKSTKNPRIRITLTVSAGEEKVTIPEITENHTEKEAVEMLKALSLKTEIVSQTSSVVPEGNVISVNPPSGTAVEKDSTVKIFVSTGADIEEITVPSVIGEHYERAGNKLKAAGLGVDEALIYENNQYNQPKDSGIVIKQNPDAGAVVERNTKTKLTVSSGFTNAKINIPVPNNATKPIDFVVLINGTVDDSLSAKGITYASNKTHEISIKDKEFATYDVVVQIKESASSGGASDYLYYVVDGKTGKETLKQTLPYNPNNGGEKTRIPAITTSDSESNAKNILESVGLKARIIKISDSSVSKGNVVRISPKAGDSVSSGSTVDVYVSTG